MQQHQFGHPIPGQLEIFCLEAKNVFNMWTAQEGVYIGNKSTWDLFFFLNFLTDLLFSFQATAIIFTEQQAKSTRFLRFFVCLLFCLQRESVATKNTTDHLALLFLSLLLPPPCTSSSSSRTAIDAWKAAPTAAPYWFVCAPRPKGPVLWLYDGNGASYRPP